MRLQKFDVYTKDTNTGAVGFTTSLHYPAGTAEKEVKKKAAAALNRSVDATFVRGTNDFIELV